MAPPSRMHGVMQVELSRLIGNHLDQQGSPCVVVGAAGVVPRVQADINIRVPDLAVTCTEALEEEHALSEPVLLVEILSPSNKSETWTNIWSYTTIPSVTEILVVDRVSIRAHLLRRGAEGNWPERAAVIEEGDLELHSIDFRVPLAALYRRTRLARDAVRRDTDGCMIMRTSDASCLDVAACSTTISMNATNLSEAR